MLPIPGIYHNGRQLQADRAVKIRTERRKANNYMDPRRLQTAARFFWICGTRSHSYSVEITTVRSVNYSTGATIAHLRMCTDLVRRPTAYE